MSAPPTTRASRSRYSSPAVGGARNANDRGRDRDTKAKGKGKENNGGGGGGAAGAFAARASSTERSRRFMESWIEPERVRMPSFQEDGLVRQGVLENMEPLGTRPKPAMIKKLTGVGREGSPTPLARGGKKKIILKRKTGTSLANSTAGASTAGTASALAPPELLSGTQSPTPSTVAGIATPAVTSPISTSEDQGLPIFPQEASQRDTDYPTGDFPPEGSSQVTHQLSRTKDFKATPTPATLSESSPLPLTAQQNSSITPTPTLTPKVEPLDTPTIPLCSDDPMSNQRAQITDSTLDAQPLSLSTLKPHSGDFPFLSQRAPSSIPHLFPPVATFTQSSDSSLRDPIKQSIEGLPTTPRSVHSNASYYDSDDYVKRESSIQSPSQLIVPSERTAEMPSPERRRSASVVGDTDESQAIAGSSVHPAEQTQQLNQPSLGPHYTEAESTRIIQQREVVRNAVQRAVAEAIKHHRYVEAYALRLAYAHNQNNARFLLQTEAMYKQFITKEAAGEWALKLKPYKDEGSKSHTALRYFVPEAETDKDFDFEAHKPQPAPYAHLVSIDLGAVRNPNKKRKQIASQAPQRQKQGQPTTVQPHVGADQQHEAQSGEGDEAEPERVATPPRKRQKTQQRDSSTARKAPSISSARAMNANGARGKSAASPLRRKTRASSNVSDVSSLSSIRTISPVQDLQNEPADAAQPSKARASSKGVAGEEDVQMQDGPDGVDGSADVGVGVGVGAGVAAVNGTSAAAPEQAARAQPIRRAATRRARCTKPNAYVLLPPDSDLDPVFDSQSHSHPNNISHQSTTTKSDPDHQQHNTTAPKNSTPSAQQKQSAKKSKIGMPDFSQTEAEPVDKVLLRLNLAREKTLGFMEEARLHTANEQQKRNEAASAESFVRNEPICAPSPPERPESASSSSSLSSVPEVEGLEPEPQSVAKKGRVNGTRATRASKRTHDEVEDDATPFSLDFGADAGPSTGGPSRATTPRPAKKQKTARRVKQSPMKNRAGPVAGGQGPSRAASRASPGVNAAAPNNQEENDDFCSFCGGNGNLVCCDGCQKAFHYMDHEPIVDPNEDAAWFCWDCMVKRDPSLVGEYKGPFGALMTNLDRRHAKAFCLPKKVREYFDGVRTGVDGEYEDFVPPVKGKKRKENEDKEFDYYQVMDKDNMPILCHSCHKSAAAATRRAILPCSICGLWWHADCLDPPKTHPPNHRTFVCPCHVDDLLLKVPAQLGPAHKFRKIKGSSDIVYAFRRGNVNNGYIEVDDDESDGEAAEAPIGMRSPKSWGRAYRVRSSGVRDDFISKVGGRNRPRKPQPRPERQLPAADYAEDAEDRYEAALNMMAFARKAHTDRGGGPVHFSSAALGVTDDDNSVYISKRRIEAATNDELRQMQAQVKRMEQRIKAQLRSRKGDEPSQSTRVTRRKTSHNRAAEVPEPQANQQVDLDRFDENLQPRDDHDSPMVIADDGAESEHDDLGLSPGQQDVPAVEEPTTEEAPAAVVEDAPQVMYENEMPDGSEASAAENNSPAPTSATKQANAFTGSAQSPADKEANETELDTDAVVAATVENIVDMAVDAALTPISDTAKESDELPLALPGTKAITNGIETPETTVADRATSPVEHEGMDLD